LPKHISTFTPILVHLSEYLYDNKEAHKSTKYFTYYIRVMLSAGKYLLSNIIILRIIICPVHHMHDIEKATTLLVA